MLRPLDSTASDSGVEFKLTARIQFPYRKQQCCMIIIVLIVIAIIVVLVVVLNSGK